MFHLLVVKRNVLSEKIQQFLGEKNDGQICSVSLSLRLGQSRKSKFVQQQDLWQLGPCIKTEQSMWHTEYLRYLLAPGRLSIRGKDR